MTRSESRVVLDCLNKTISLLAGGQVVVQAQLAGAGRASKGESYFELCCAVGVVQSLHSDGEHPSTWPGADDNTLLELREALGWTANLGSLHTYWSELGKGEDAGQQRSTITDREGSPTTQGTLLFCRHERCMFLGERYRVGCGYSYHPIEFQDTNERWKDLYSAVLERHRRRRPTRYLRAAEDLLGFEGTPPREPVWFRDGGPLAADFTALRVYRRESALQQLKSVVLNNHITLLEGEPACGKTVLVRNMASDLLRARGLPIYFFGLDELPDFDPAPLVDDINNTFGLIVLEDIHLDPETLCFICSRLKPSPNRHLLLTGQPLGSESYPRWNDMRHSIMRVSFDAAEDVSAIIDHYASHPEHSGSQWPIRVKGLIRSLAGRDLWLLTSILKGYTAARQQGDPDSWAEAGVLEDLRSLHRHGSYVPLAIVALSPLSLSGVGAAESFLLTRWPQLQEPLRILSEQGHIRKWILASGDAFYDLPHPGRAGVYWRHGKTYRRQLGIEDYDEFLYAYATADTPNGVEAVMTSDREVRTRVLYRLMRHRRIQSIIAREQSLLAIARAVGELDHETLRDHCLLDVLEEKLAAWTPPVAAAACLCNITRAEVERPEAAPLAGQSQPSTAEDLWDLLDIDRVAAAVSGEDDVGNVGLCIRYLFCASPKIGRDLWGHLNLDALAGRLASADDLHGVASCIDHIREACPEDAAKLMTRVPLSALAQAVNSSADVVAVGRVILAVHRANRSCASALWQLLNGEHLRHLLWDKPHLHRIRRCLSLLHQVSEEYWRLAWSNRDMDTLVTALNDAPMQDTCLFLSSLQKVSPAEARDTGIRLDAGMIAERLEDVQGLLERASCLRQVSEVCEVKGKEVETRLHVGDWRDRVRREEDVGGIAFCLSHLRHYYPELARTLSDSVDVKSLAEMCSINSEHLDAFYRQMHIVNPAALHAFWSLLDMDSVGRSYSLKAGDALTIAVNTIGSLCEDHGREIVSRLRSDVMAEVLRNKETNERYECVSSLLAYQGDARSLSVLFEDGADFDAYRRWLKDRQEKSADRPGDAAAP